MPQPIDFTEFFCCFYINFLSINGIIEVPPTTTHHLRRKFMANNYHQLSLKDTFSDCKDLFLDGVPSFFQLLEQHFDVSLFIPQTFYNAFYQHLGRKRDYLLTGFLSALILQIFHPYRYTNH